MKRLAFFLFALVVAMNVAATSRHLLPTPQQMTLHTGSEPFALQRAVRITDPTASVLLRQVLTDAGATIADDAAAEVRVSLVDAIDGAYDYTLYGFENEAYTLTVSASAVEIQAITPTGVIRAAQTLRQLAEADDEGWAASVEAVEIVDWPAFKLRGAMHDVGRSFIEFETLKRQIDLLARFKINTFHWHLTENQAWRFEVQAYPALTQAASMTRFAGKYYTQAQCTELEAYAAERGVVVIPEVDMPGHSEAFQRAMGHSMQTDQGVQELQVILEEVAQAFPLAPYIHIGADEQTITYTNFLQTMTAKVHALGKKVVVWNPISGVTITPSSLGVDMTQMWSTSGKKISGIPNIDCRYNYTNHFDVFADLAGIFRSSIYYETRGSEEVAGFISCPWNDRKTPTEEDILAQNNVYAVTIACGERAWKGGGRQYIEQGGAKLPNEGEEFDEFADWEARFLWHKSHSLKDEPIPYVRQTNVRWRVTEQIPNGGVSGTILPPEEAFNAQLDEIKAGEGDILPKTYTLGSTTYGSKLVTGAGIYLRHTWGSTVPAHFTSPETGNTAYAWTYVYSPVAQTVGAQIEFQNYGRSEVDTAPDKGCWDRKGSRIWMNGEEILPPVWDNTGVSVGKEVDLRNENFPARSPIRVDLKEGWNLVFLKLPYMSASGVRLNKWLWTFVLTDLEGKHAVEGLIYSPSQSMEGEDSEDTTSDRLIQPVTSTEEAPVYYYFAATQRCKRYVASAGAGSNLVSLEATADNAAWALIEREDGTFDIRNYADQTYISPTATYNTSLKSVAARPEKGWTLSEGDAEGFYIFASGETEINQTGSGLGYAVYNWGGGSNTSDLGCQFKFYEASDLGHEVVADKTPTDNPTASEADAPFYYYITADQRVNRFIGATGADANLASYTDINELSAWALINRGDGTMDVVNYGTGTYLSPEAAQNTSLYTRTDQPSAGWTLSPAATSGYFILTSGTAQVNQCNAGLSYQVYNWGSGTNTTDTGCQLKFYEATALNLVTDLPSLDAAVGATDAIFTIDGRRLPAGTRPARGLYIVGGRKRVF